MIHELIDPKKKKNKTSVSTNPKTIQNTKNILDYCNFEQSYYENKNTESSSATFIPPWLKNSLGLNQKNILSHATAGSDQKASKIIERDKESSQNEFDTLRRNAQHDCCKEWKNQAESETKNCPQGTATSKAPDHAKTLLNNSETYRNVRNKGSETEINYTNAEIKSLGPENWIKIIADVITSSQVGNFKDEDIKKIRLIKQRNSLRKQIPSDQRSFNADKSDIDFLLQMKAKEVVENFKKKEVHSVSPEKKNLETKLMLLGAKNHDSNSFRLKQQDIQLLQEMKNKIVSMEDFERMFEHMKVLNLREIIQRSDLINENSMEKKRKEKEEKEKKSGREASQTGNYNAKVRGNQDCLLSTDEEENIKKFSNLVSKNGSFDEKKKCLQEVRNYFEKKRKLHLTKRRLEDEKKKPNAKSDKKEENVKEKSKKDSKGVKLEVTHSFDEEVMEKAVEETLQKFTDLYHINLTPAVVETMKKSIFHCISSNASKANRSASLMNKTNLDQPSLGGKELEKIELSTLPESPEVSKNESAHYKELKKKNVRTLIESLEEQNLSVPKETEMTENEKFQRLRKEFDNFLHSVEFHIDFTNLKLQSIILEKEEQAASSKNVQFVYNFTKKSLEQEKTEVTQSLKEGSEMKSYKDSEAQTVTDDDLLRRNVKVQAFDFKCTCEQSLQTDGVNCATESTETNKESVSVQEVKELKSFNVNPGLYRMVRSKEAGKFYLYPEQLDGRRTPLSQNSDISLVANKKLCKKKDLLNMISKNPLKDRRFCIKANTKLRKKKKTGGVCCENVSIKENKNGLSKGNSVNCLFFRNLSRSHSGLFLPKKEKILLNENVKGRIDDSDDLGLGDALQITNKEHLGCFWFWNGQRIGPGCDLKAHVESLLKEKLKEMFNFSNQNNMFAIKSFKNKKDSKKISKKMAVLHLSSSMQNTTKENSMLGEEERLDENEKKKKKKKKSKNEEKKIETDDTGEVLSEEKSIRNMAIQNSQQACLPADFPKLKIQGSKIRFPVRKKTNKTNLVVKQRRKPITKKKSENFAEAIEELKRIKLETENSKRAVSRDSESLFNFSLSTKESKNEVDSPLPKMFRRQDSLEVTHSNFKNKLRKLISLVNCEIQRNDIDDIEDRNSSQNSPAENQNHFELIETVLNRITHKERENLWNDVREFIKTRISRDMNDDDDREVCIEIEQDLHKNDRGKLRDILAKGHYRRNEGDIEVEIDLTLDDLERILRQRQKKNRRRSLCRSSQSNKFLSTSSIQSDCMRDDLRKYQKYIQNFSTSGGGRVQEKEMKAFL